MHISQYILNLQMKEKSEKGDFKLDSFNDTILIPGYIGDKVGYKITLMLTLTATAAEIVIFTFLPKYTTMPKFKVN